MITKGEKETILKCAKKYNVSEIYLFGSSTEKKSTPNDVDLGVKGLQPRLFFKFYGELFKNLSKPVDLVDLTEKNLFNSLIEKDGVKIYAKSV